MFSKKIKVNRKVKEALENNKSIVALESTLISHGLPYPENIKVANESIKAVEEALSKDRMIFLASQKNLAEEAPSPDSIYETGTIAMIMRMRKLPDGRVKILIQGVSKGKVSSYLNHEPFHSVKVDKCVN